MSANILLVEDEVTLAESLAYILDKQGYTVRHVIGGIDALQAIHKEPPDLVILDLMIPQLDGFEVCKQIRTFPNYIPVIILTARGEEVDKILGLELGADDYLVKPFSTRELEARIKTVFRRHKIFTPQREQISCGDLLLDFAAGQVFLNNKEIELAPKERALLEYLMKRLGKVAGRQELLEAIWGPNFMGDPKTLEVHVRWLREKIEPNPAIPKYLITVKGKGYRIGPV